MRLELSLIVMIVFGSLLNMTLCLYLCLVVRLIVGLVLCAFMLSDERSDDVSVVSYMCMRMLFVLAIILYHEL